MRRLFYVLLIALLAPQVIFADAVPGAPISEPAPVRLVVGRSAIVDTGTPIARVSLTSADIADALVTGPTQLLINGKTPGTISMFVWERSGAVKRYEVVVARDVAKLTDQMRQLFPDERINVESNGRGIVLSGSVSTKDVSEKAASLAGGYVDKKDDVINLTQIAEGGASNQVLLRVRFAEVSRNAMTELGASYFTGPNGYKDWIARGTTQEYPAPVFDNSNPSQEKLVFSDFLNLFLFNTKHQLGTVIKALQTRGLFQSLAEPNLVAESGKEASFLAGGEFPIPVAQGSGSNIAISVQFKEFGIRLTFTPVVTGNRVHLKVRPEVSTLDFNNAVVLQGFRIPALSTRRTETELELEDHQTFAIAGLLNNTMQTQLQKIPGIGDIPILGLLFKSKQAQKDQTELVVMITPEILRNNSVGVTPNLPRIPEPFLPPLPEKKSKEMPPPAFRPDQSRVQNGQPMTIPAQAQMPQAPNPAAAAAAMSALTPQGPKVMSGTKPAQPAAMPMAGQPGAAAMPNQPAAVTPMPAVATRPLTSEEKKALERARDLQEKQQKAEAEQAKKDAKAAAERKEKEDKLAKEQAKRDAENAKKAAEIARRQAEEAKKQQKVIDEAAAKLKAAEAAYQAEIAKKQQQQPPKQ